MAEALPPIIDSNTLFGFWPTRRVHMAEDALVAGMKKWGVARSLCVSTTGIFYDFRQGNEETLEAGQRQTELVPVATVDPRQYLDCFAEVDKRAAQGFRLFRFFPDLQGWPLEFAPFQELLAKLDQMKLPAMVPCPALGSLTLLASKTASLTTPLLVTGVGYGNLGEAMSVMQSDPKVVIEAHGLSSPDAYEVLASKVGTDRVVFGSFAPYHSLASAVLPLARCSLTTEQKTQIASGNIRRVLTGGQA